MINDVVCCEMFNGSQNQFFTSTQDNHSLRPVYARQFYAITHFSHISGKCAYRILFPHKSTSSTAIVIFLVFSITRLFLLVLLPRPSGCLQCFDAVGWAAGRASGL